MNVNEDQGVRCVMRARGGQVSLNIRVAKVCRKLERLGLLDEFIECLNQAEAEAEAKISLLQGNPKRSLARAIDLLRKRLSDLE